MRASVPRWVVLAAFVVLTVAFSASAAPINEKPKSESTAEKIRKALDQPIDLDLADQPLTAVLDYFRDQTKINFIADQITIASLGIDPMTSPVATVKLSNVKTRTALRSALAHFNLSYAIVGEAVCITSEDMAIVRQLRQRVSVDLNGVKLDAALKQLAKETGVNLLVDPKSAKEAQTAVTLQLDDVPLETAVRLVAEMVGLKAARVGNVLIVTSKAHAAELRAETDLVGPRPGVNGLEQLLVPGGMFPGGIGVAPAVPDSPPNP